MAGFESGLFQKLFKGYILDQLVPSVDQYIIELFAYETNLIKKAQCETKKMQRDTW